MKSILLALLGIFCLTMSQAAEVIWKPDVMFVQIGGFDGPSYQITYDTRQLCYYASNRGRVGVAAAKPQAISVKEEEWQIFLSTLNELKVWKWASRYQDNAVADGTTWRVIIGYYYEGEQRAIACSGANAYPPEFQRFLAAVKRLIGGRSFE